MGEQLTRAELAARSKVTRQRVEELIREGRLTERDGRIDADEARAVFEAMDPSYKLRRESALAATGEERDGPPQSHAVLYNKAKASEAVLKVKQRELDYKIKSGAYVEREGVKRAGFKAGKIFANKCGNAASQLAPQLVGRKDVKEIHEIIATFMSQLVQDIRDELAGIG